MTSAWLLGDVAAGAAPRCANVVAAMSPNRPSQEIVAIRTDEYMWLPQNQSIRYVTGTRKIIPYRILSRLRGTARRGYGALKFDVGGSWWS